MIRRRSTRQAGRLVPPQAQGLRAAVVRLGRGQLMDWHSTRAREELLIALAGRVDLEIRLSARRVRRLSLGQHQSVFLPAQTLHRVVNRSETPARYIYVTASVT